MDWRPLEMKQPTELDSYETYLEIVRRQEERDRARFLGHITQVPQHELRMGADGQMAWVARWPDGDDS